MSREDATIPPHEVAGNRLTVLCDGPDRLDALIALMESGGDGMQPVNLGNPVELTVRELADRVVKLTGTRKRVVYLPLPQDDPRRRRPDIDRARALLGWEPQVALADGLEKTCAWFAQELARVPEQVAAE